MSAAEKKVDQQQQNGADLLWKVSSLSVCL